MGYDFFVKGAIIGFSIAAPVGPIGVLCIRRTLADGRAAGLVSGLGAATADAFYGCIAGFGLTALSTLLIDLQQWLRLGGGLFLLCLGVRTLLTRPAKQEVSSGGMGLITAYASTFFLTLTNPMTILSFAAIFAGLGIVSAQGNPAAAGFLVAGVFTGSALWWLLLSGGVGIFQARVTPEGLSWVNRLAGGVLVAFGVVILIGAVS